MTSLADQLACAQRELALRRNTYPKWIAAGRMSQAKADHEIEAMAAIVATLEKAKLLEEVSIEMQQTFPALTATPNPSTPNATQQPR